jgi:hypothetical protein
MSYADSLVCPISNERTDHNASRVTCLLTIASIGAFAATASPLVALPLAADYTMRAWMKPKSPMQRAAAGLAQAIRLPKKSSDAAPKRFAARIGFLFAVAAAVLLPISAQAAVAVAATLAFFNVLDGVFNFCVGCWMYTLLVVPNMGRFPALARL